MPQTNDDELPDRIDFNRDIIAAAAMLGVIAIANWAMIYLLGIQGFWLLLVAPLANAVLLAGGLACSDVGGLQNIVSVIGPLIAILVDWKLAWGQMPVC